MSLCDFFLKYFLNVHMSTQQRVTRQNQCFIFNLIATFVIFVQFSSNFV